MSRQLLVNDTAPAVLDHNQQVAQSLRAKVTPEAFVIDRQGKTHYQGRIDDLYADFGKRRRTPKIHDLKNALQALVAGKKIEQPMTNAIGCYISYVDSR